MLFSCRISCVHSTRKFYFQLPLLSGGITVNLPLVDPIADKLRKFLGEEKAFKLIRRKNVFLSNAFWRFCQNYPNAARKLIVNGIRKQLPSDFDVDTHFNPPYNPWDQRLCTVPDGDFFKAISAGKASVETDTLAEFVGDGIKLTTSGKELKADVVITATGFKLKMFGGMDVKIDGEKQNLGEKVSYKGMMLNDIPNLAFIVGYTNSSWTLKVDLLCEQFCKIQNYMTEHDYEQCVPKLPTGYFETRPLLDFGAGYVQRALSELPRQGRKAPWKMSMDFDSDVRLIRRSPVKDVYLHFNRGEHDKRSHAQDGLVTASA